MPYTVRITTLGAFTLGLALVGCRSTESAETFAPLPETSPEALQQLLESSQQPLVLNVWASWCIPCRAEGPLLAAAHERFGDEVRFVGLNVRDNRIDAGEFIAEFELGGFEHYFDPTGAAQGSLGAGGVPLTFFFAPGGDQIELHFGVIDERTLAINVDEIIRASAAA